MNTRTRRQLLAALTGLAGGLAGCAGQSATSSRSVSETNRRTIPDDNAVTDPPMLKRRSTATRSPIQLRVEQPQDGGEASEDDANEPSRRVRQATNEVIDTAATADRLVSNLDDGDDNADGDTTGDDSELSAFIAATDFESETLYLETRQIEQCFRLSLCFVSWQETEIHTSYDRRLRPYDAQCTADREVTEARLIRLPVALSADSINSIGTSIGSARCRQVVETRANDSATDSGMTSDTGVSSGGSA